MPPYRFVATDSTGKTVRGILQADDEQAARHRVEGRGLTPVSVEAAVLKKPRPEIAVGSGRMRVVAPVLILLALLAVAAFLFFDPYGWFRSLEPLRERVRSLR